MLRIGLTGGIGSGKSTVAELFAALGVPVIDTDEIARELVEPGQPALADIRARFGAEFIDDQGRLKRALLRTRVFAVDAERKVLEAILHPRIRAEVERRIENLAAPYVIIVVPLLLESGWSDLVDRVLVVDVPTEIQRARVTAREGLDARTLDGILAAQLSREARRVQGDDILDNSGTRERTARQVASLHHSYLHLADASPNR